MLLLPGIALSPGVLQPIWCAAPGWQDWYSVKALLTAIYLTCYYLGTALLGTASGELWHWQAGRRWFGCCSPPGLALLTSYWLPTVQLKTSMLALSRFGLKLNFIFIHFLRNLMLAIPRPTAADDHTSWQQIADYTHQR